MEKRLDRTAELLAFHTHDEVVRKLSTQFKCAAGTAKRWIRKVQKRITADLQRPRREWVADTLHQLNEIIRTDKDARLDAIKQRTTLLGLNAPTQLKLSVEGLYQAPDQWRALSNPEFLQQAMALEVEYGRMRLRHGNGHGNGGQAEAATPRAAAEQLRLFGMGAVPVSPSPPSASEGGAQFAFPGGLESADC